MRKYCAEFIGTFVLVFLGTGTVAITNVRTVSSMQMSPLTYRSVSRLNTKVDYIMDLYVYDGVFFNRYVNYFHFQSLTNAIQYKKILTSIPTPNKR
jgi:glycerol uptake facilitator-like aquaporin